MRPDHRPPARRDGASGPAIASTQAHRSPPPHGEDPADGPRGLSEQGRQYCPIADSVGRSRCRPDVPGLLVHDQVRRHGGVPAGATSEDSKPFVARMTVRSRGHRGALRRRWRALKAGGFLLVTRQDTTPLHLQPPTTLCATTPLVSVNSERGSFTILRLQRFIYYSPFTTNHDARSIASPGCPRGNLPTRLSPKQSRLPVCIPKVL